MLSIKLLLPFISGIFNKLYDDLVDNKCLKPYKNKFIMELLKGLHYITFTSVGLQDPLFFIIHYCVNIFNFFGGKNSWENPYENSLFYSFFILWFIIDYSKIKRLYTLDYIIICLSAISCFIEPKIVKIEVSLLKLIMRLGCVFTGFFMVSYFPVSPSMLNVIVYLLGYFLLSTIIQYVSLFVLNDKHTIAEEKCQTHKYYKSKKEKKERRKQKRRAERLVKKQAAEARENTKIE